MEAIRQYLQLQPWLLRAYLLFLLPTAIAQDATLDTSPIKSATIMTTLGNIEIELYPEQAPITVANFSRYIKAGAYNKGRFYRVVRFDNDNGSPKIQVIQGGAATNFTDFEPIPLENTEATKVRHLDGVLSMARGTPNSATSEFFICVGAQPSLDFGGSRNPDGLGFAAFGRVTLGMDIVKAILNITDTLAVEDEYVKDQMLTQPISITQIVTK
ncbi:peptidylprolyl isomerase [Paraglaciecola sp. 2405UD69-4]|uniref:peptidylprolyl isomerase n=1 Tax=Paraglaciecola sp. 2405UD69-4 TaxID=3391836 RepID=UPI0039C8E546